MTTSRATPRPSKAYPTLGCCGIDCGLCPRYHAAGSSRCPGCGGPGFFEKHPACGALSCCAGKKRVEACSLCDEFPCARVSAWKDADSFVTHRRCRANLDAVKAEGLKAFLGQQRKRIVQLERMLAEFDDGRSKGFYCLAAALLSTEALETSAREAARRVRSETADPADRKARAAILRGMLMEHAAREGVELRLRAP
jgi:hypothetical protein